MVTRIATIFVFSIVMTQNEMNKTASGSKLVQQIEYYAGLALRVFDP